MAPILSLVVRRELKNLEKDQESRRSAMKALKIYVKGLDAKAIPFFLAQLSKTKEPGSCTGEYTISLYEVLARAHRRNMVPHIDNIMSTVIKTLSMGSGSFSLHQACAKVAPTIVRYGIDHTTSNNERTRIVCSICKQLSDVLSCSQASTASGAAVCLKALAECDNWRFASDNAVNGVCEKVVGALEEELTQTCAHMSLAMALLKHNVLIVEPYSRSLICSGLRILFHGLKESNSQKRLSAVQMINFLMKCVDTRRISSELPKVMDSLERCQNDPMPFVSGAALEALHTARMISCQKMSKHERSLSQGFLCERSTGSVMDSNFGTRSSRTYSWISSHDANTKSDVSPTEFPSLESRSSASFLDYDYFLDLAISIGNSSNCDYSRRTNRKLWIHDANDIDMEANNQTLHRVNSGYNIKQNGVLSEKKGVPENSSVFVRTSATTEVKQESVSSLQLMPPLPASSISDSECFRGERTGYATNSCSGEVGWGFQTVPNECNTNQYLSCEFRGWPQEAIQDCELPSSHFIDTNASNLSATTGSPAAHAIQTSCIEGFKDHQHNLGFRTKKRYKKATIISMVCTFLFLVISFALGWAGNQAKFLVPT